MYITVGRDPKSDIVITGQDRVSNNHATIEYNGGNFLFIDDSSNGTLINGRLVHHASCPIKQGDVILLAKVYPLGWDKILSKVGGARYQARNIADRPTQMYTNQQYDYARPQQPVYQPQPQQQVRYEYRDETPRKSRSVSARELDKWNWGAFLLGWIWGVFNNVYWMLIALIPIPLVALIVNIIAGIKGTRQAWENGRWRDEEYEAFAKKQQGWLIAGFIVWGGSILLSVILWSTIINMFASLM